MAVKKEFHTDALPIYSKKSFLIRQPSLEKELGVPFKIKQKIKGNWEFVESVK